MAAKNTVTKTGGWSYGEKVTYTQITAVDAAAAACVPWSATGDGAKVLPFVFGGSTSATDTIFYRGSTGECYVNNTAGSVFFPIELMHGHVLNEVSLSFTPAGGHAGAPAILPAIWVVCKNTAGTVLSLGTDAYSWVDVPTYDGGSHILTVSGIAHTVDNSTYNYFVRYRSESGANSVTGTELIDLSAEMTKDASTDLSLWIG